MNVEIYLIPRANSIIFKKNGTRALMEGSLASGRILNETILVTGTYDWYIYNSY